MRDILRTKIHHGAFPNGFLPGEPELMAAYGSSRATVRAALGLLRDEGLIDRQQGTGTFVVSRNASMMLQEAHGVIRPERSAFEDHRAVELDRSWVTMPDVVAERLDAQPGTRCLRVEYVSYHLVLDCPMGLATNYVTDPEASAIGSLPLHRSWYELLDRAGITVAESEFRIGCMLADDPTAKVLDIERGSAVLTIEQVIRDAADRAYNFAYVASRGDQTFVSTARRPA